MIPPVAYQGGKQRISSLIVDRILELNPSVVCDLCCGSGAISLELMSRGFAPESIYMLDRGPWGLVWEAMGNGTFDLARFEHHINLMPSKVEDIQAYVKELSRQPVDADAVYIYLILQASSFGSKAIWIDEGKWMNCSFRSYWLPTATSSRRSPVNPMMPMPKTLLQRVADLLPRVRGVHGYCMDIDEFIPPSNSVVYIDPPYLKTTAYGFDFDVIAYANRLKVPCLVSEALPLTDKAECIAEGRAKGGISGERTKFTGEWLSRF